MDEWDEVKEISVKEMDEQIQLLREQKEELDKVNKQAKEVKAKYDEQQNKVMKMLEDSGRKSYACDHGRINIMEKLAVRVPSGTENKKRFFEWLKKELGDDAMDSYATVPSQSLNALYNELSEQYAKEGKVLEIDGLDTPVTRKVVSFTKK